MSDYYYRELPSGNASEFPAIAEYLRKRRVWYSFHEKKSGGRIYRFTLRSLTRLPKHEGRPFIPARNNGTEGYELLPHYPPALKIKDDKWQYVTMHTSGGES